MAFGRAVSPSVAGRLFGRSHASQLALLSAAWPHAVGSEIARRSEVVSYENGMLNVRVAFGQWQRVLNRMAPEILERLGAVAGGIAPRRLGFVQGSVGDDTDPRPLREEPPVVTPASIEEASLAIDDPALRASFVRAATLYLARDQNA